MRLTNIDRDAFVKAVIDDVPQIDYEELYRIRMQQWCVDHLPPEAKELHKTRPDLIHTELRACVLNRYVATVGRESPKTDAAFVAELRELKADWDAQNGKIDALKAKLKAAIYGCTTLKQALTMLPEFEKYLPKERGGKVERSMPAIANLVADLSSAGWPKGKA